MTKDAAETEPEEEPAATPATDPWDDATPRLKAIMREALEEWLAESPDLDVEEKDANVKPEAAAVDRGSARPGRNPGSAARAGAEKAGTRRGQQTPSGGSIFDVLLGR